MNWGRAPNADALSAWRWKTIEAKLQSLDNELERWERQTNDPGPLGRHQNQIGRLASTFGGLLTSVRASIDGVDRGSREVLERAEAWENQILAAHSIWDVFRVKLVLRQDPVFQKILAACDDLAWACYEPAMKAFDPDRKAPPLVYFTATWSAFAVSRDSNFENEVRAGYGSGLALDSPDFERVMQRLPVPLIGIPWYQAFHLPGAVVIAHEAGHLVEADFTLTDEIAAALDQANLAQGAAWKSWASEVFADLYGCLCMGPAYVASVMELLASSERAIHAETRRSPRYPPRALRVELLLEALRQLEHTEAARLEKVWYTVYGELRVMHDCLPDVPKVVGALYERSYKHKAALPTIAKFKPGQGSDIQRIAWNAASGITRPDAYSDDPRVLFAAAQNLHENPPSFMRPEAFEIITEQMFAKVVTRHRSSFEDRAAAAAWEDRLDEQKAADRKNGERLATDLELLMASYQR